MRAHLFIHASCVVKNKRELPSKILSKINGRTVLEMMLDRLKGLSVIEKIIVVTSSTDCDSEIAGIAEKFVKTYDDFGLIKLEPGKPFSFDDSNKTIESNLLYKLPAYGLYNSGLLKDYFASNSIDAAVLTVADDTPFIEPELIARLVSLYYKQGVIYGTRYPGENLLVVPVESLSKIASCQYNLTQKLEDGINSIEDDIDQIKAVNPKINTAEVIKRKEDFLNSTYKREITVFDLLYALEVKKVVAQPSERYQFYPVYSDDNIRFAENFFVELEKISLDGYEHISNSLKAGFNKLTPATLEIELTSRCNVECDSYPNPEINREDVDITREHFELILESFSSNVQYLVFSGFGEPTLHPDLFDFIRFAKKKGFLSVCLETNGTGLDKQYITKLIDSGLDILTVKIDELDLYCSGDLPKAESVIDMVYDIKRERKFNKPYLVVQAVNRMSNQNKVQYYYKRWDNIADTVSIQPFNDYCGTFDQGEQINLAPLTPVQECAKTAQGQFVFADGSLSLCKQKFDGFNPSNQEKLNEIWIDNYYRGNYFDFCGGCIMKYYRECVQPDRFDTSFKFKIDSEILSKHIKNSIVQAEELYNEKQYGKCMSFYEKILKFCPDNVDIYKKLEKIETLI
jgi:uncharacterized radical SAM superfamily Fe-S cluster-containing enzyme